MVIESSHGDDNQRIAEEIMQLEIMHGDRDRAENRLAEISCVLSDTQVSEVREIIGKLRENWKGHAA